MKIAEVKTSDGQRLLRVETSVRIDLSGKEITDKIENDIETIESSYTLGEPVKEEETGGVIYTWYEILSIEKRMDKFPAVNTRITDLEEQALEAEYEITLLQAGLEE